MRAILLYFDDELGKHKEVLEILNHLPSWLSICVVGFVFALTHMHSLSLSEWVSAVGYLGGGVALSIIYVNEKGNIYYPLMVHVLGNILSFIVLVIGSVQ